MSAKPVLLIEDDENDVFFFQRAASKAGMVNPVRVARDGREAINYLHGAGEFAQRAKFPLPCLILLDLKLPFVMGLDVLKWIRQQPSLAPIVLILSSSREEADIATAYRLGAQGYLVKPAEAGKLKNTVKAINDFWLTQNTPPPCPKLNQGRERVADQQTQGVTVQQCAPVTRSLSQESSGIHRSDL